MTTDEIIRYDIVLDTLAENDKFNMVLCNYFGLHQHIKKAIIYRELKSKKPKILIRNIFKSSINTYNNHLFINSMDNGLMNLRILRKSKALIYLEDTQSLRFDLEFIKTISPPLYEYCLKIITID